MDKGGRNGADWLAVRRLAAGPASKGLEPLCRRQRPLGKAMITFYLRDVSVVIASVFGIPLDVLSDQNDRANRIVGAMIDTLQTLPSFVFLVPVVMPFRVRGLSAMIAVVLYARAGGALLRPWCAKHRSADDRGRDFVGLRPLAAVAPHKAASGDARDTARPEPNHRASPLLADDHDAGRHSRFRLGVVFTLKKAETGRGVIAGPSIAIIANRILSDSARHTRARLGLIGGER